jgi:hypothetical protein
LIFSATTQLWQQYFEMHRIIGFNWKVNYFKVSTLFHMCTPKIEYQRKLVLAGHLELARLRETVDADLSHNVHLHQCIDFAQMTNEEFIGE